MTQKHSQLEHQSRKRESGFESYCGQELFIL